VRSSRPLFKKDWWNRPEDDLLLCANFVGQIIWRQFFALSVTVSKALTVRGAMGERRPVDVAE
jgi:hypothetical protein